jgi:hypothetical protein
VSTSQGGAYAGSDEGVRRAIPSDGNTAFSVLEVRSAWRLAATASHSHGYRLAGGRASGRTGGRSAERVGRRDRFGREGTPPTGSDSDSPEARTTPGTRQNRRCRAASLHRTARCPRSSPRRPSVHQDSGRFRRWRRVRAADPRMCARATRRALHTRRGIGRLSTGHGAARRDRSLPRRRFEATPHAPSRRRRSRRPPMRFTHGRRGQSNC